MARPKMLIKKPKHAISAWVDKDLFEKAKTASYQRGITITKLIEDAMRKIVKESENGNMEAS